MIEQPSPFGFCLFTCDCEAALRRRLTGNVSDGVGARRREGEREDRGWGVGCGGWGGGGGNQRMLHLQKDFLDPPVSFLVSW